MTSCNQNADLAAWCNASDARDGSWCKRKGFYSGAGTWENGGLPSQRPPPLPAQAPSSYRDRSFIFLSNYHSSFWCTHCKNLPLHHLGQWGRFPSAPCLWDQGHCGGWLWDRSSGGLEMLQLSVSSWPGTQHLHTQGSWLESARCP